MKFIAMTAAFLCSASLQMQAQKPAAPTFAPRATADRPDLDSVFEKLDAYLEKYEGELSAVVADEIMVQEVEGRLIPRETRRLLADVAFVRLPGDFEWLGFRHVKMLNGTPLATYGPSLAELLATNTADTVAQANLLVSASSKYNLGNPRTVNMPNLPLELLNRRYRHRYDSTLDGRERVRGRAVNVVSLTELGPPPIVFNNGHGGDIQTTVRGWIDAESGALWRAEVRMKRFNTNATRSKLRVEFAVDKGLGIMVPIEMREDFLAVLGTGRGHYTYSNFRRFQTSARIVPPPG